MRILHVFQKILVCEQMITPVKLFPNCINSGVLAEKGRYHCQFDWGIRKGWKNQDAIFPY